MPQVPLSPAGASAPERRWSGFNDWMGPATRWLALLVATAVVAYLCWLLLEPFVDVLMWGVVLVVTFNPVHRRLRQRFQSPGVASALACLIVIVVILIPITLLTIAVVRDAANVAAALQERKNEFLDPNDPSAIGKTLRWVDQYVDIDRFRSQQYIGERALTAPSEPPSARQ